MMIRTVTRTLTISANPVLIIGVNVARHFTCAIMSSNVFMSNFGEITESLLSENKKTLCYGALLIAEAFRIVSLKS